MPAVVPAANYQLPANVVHNARGDFAPVQSLAREDRVYSSAAHAFAAEPTRLMTIEDFDALVMGPQPRAIFLTNDGRGEWSVVARVSKKRVATVARVECTSANAAKYDRVCMNAAVIADFLETADGAEEASGVVVEKLDKLPKKLARADIQQLFEHAAESLALQHRVADMVQGKGEEQMGLFGDEYDQDLEAFADINAVDAASRSRGVVSRKLLSIYDGTCGPHNPCEEGFCCSREGNCGKSEAYCGAGCQLDYSGSHSACHDGPNPNVHPHYPIGPGGECGVWGHETFGCGGSNCCSRDGYCGMHDLHCAHDCQPEYSGLDSACLHPPVHHESPSPHPIPPVHHSPPPIHESPSPHPVHYSPPAHVPHSPEVHHPSPKPHHYPLGPDGECGVWDHETFGCDEGECCSGEGYCGHDCGHDCQPEFSGRHSECTY